MVSFIKTYLRIGQVLRWAKEDNLVLQPKFQRRLCWEPNARSYLIDTIVNGYPMPKVYLRKAINPKTKLMAYEVVDGQQRLAAIIDFIEGRLRLSQKHNREFGDNTFSELPDSVQRNFLQYEISTEIMENASDSEVLQMFERLNSYTLPLNRQEKRNAEFFGYFKQTAYKLAAEQSSLDAWRNLRVFSNRQIARMAEVELTSDVLLAIIDGISDITAITKAYYKYDERFQAREFAEDTFRKTLSFIAKELPEVVRKTRFRNRAWFYSLMVAVADTIEGINGGNGPGKLQPPSEIQKRMFAVDVALKTVMLPPGLGGLQNSLSRQTSHVPPRIVRHDHFFLMLNLSKEPWEERWKQLNTVPPPTKPSGTP